MKITLTIEADCDPPPRNDERLEEALDDVLNRFEGEVAWVLADFDAGFGIDSTRKIEP